jgi:protein-disulfide isomerase
VNVTKRKSENVKLTMPISESRDHIQGSASAPVTLLEYGDYECPYCAQAYIIIKEAQERLGSKLGFVFHNFPVTKVRPHAYETALAYPLIVVEIIFKDLHLLL